MYPRLSDLLEGLFGFHILLPVQTYGLFVALAFVTAGILLRMELRRREKTGQLKAQKQIQKIGAPLKWQDWLSGAIFGFIIGFKGFWIATHYTQFANNPQTHLLSTEGSWFAGIGVALLLCGINGYQNHKKRLPQPISQETLIHPHQHTINIVVIAALFGLAGAKLFDVIEHLDQLFKDPLGTLFSFSGLTFYGGLLMASGAVVYYGERKNIPWPVMADSVAPALILAYAVGRMGCHLSGDGCWGIVNLQPKPEWMSILPDWMWAFSYPHNVINEGLPISHCVGPHCFELAQPVFPTSFYESIMGTVLFTILWSLRKKAFAPGTLFAIYLVFNGAERFFIEQFRVNIRYTYFGIQVTQAQIIACGLILTGIAGGYYFYKRNIKRSKHES